MDERADQPGEFPRDLPGDLPGEAAVEAFWNVAKVHARMNPAGSYFGPTALESVRPSDWSYGDTPDEATAFATRLVVDGVAELHTPAADFDGDLPSEGTLGILLDGTGAPVALVATTGVSEADGVVTERLEVVYAAE